MNTSDFLAHWKPNNFYHFTESSNLKSIRAHGILSLSELERLGIGVSTYASSESSRGIDTHYGFDKYVRLCFANQHPMEYRAKKEGRLTNSKFLRITPSILLKEGVLVADGVPYADDSTVFENFEEAAAKLDWEVLFTKTEWKNPEIQSRLKKARKYELLVPLIVLPELIKNL